MSINAGTVVAYLDMDTSKYSSALKTAGAQLGVLESQSASLGDKLTGLGSSLKTVGATMAVGFTVPILAAGAAGIKLASDFDESLNKVNEVFDESASEVEAWSQKTLEASGIAQGTALDMSALFGDMAVSMGLPTEKAAAMSMSLVGLAGDMASFKNISIDRAQTALAGVYTGETEALKSLGIVMTQANLEAFALAQGIQKPIKEMTQGELVALRYAYVMDVTKNAHGDFAKTSDGAANQMRIFQESIKELGASFGQHLLPIFTPMVQKLNETLKWFGELDEGTKKTIVAIAGIVAAIGPVLMILGTLLSTVGPVIGAFKALGSAMVVFGGGLTSIPWAIAALTGPLGWMVGGLTAAGLAVYGLSNHLSKDAIPAVDRFGNEVSDGTKKALGAFFELSDGATVKLNELSWGGKAVSEDMRNDVTANFDQMANQIATGIDSAKTEALQSLQILADNSKTITQEEKNALINGTTQAYDGKKQIVQDGNARIKEIMNAAATENRAITQAEKDEIKAIQKSMTDQAVQYLTQNEIEQKAIIERMKAQASELTAQQAAEVVKNSKEQTDKTIEETNRQYNAVVAEIVKQRDEAGTITAEQAKKLIDEATRQKDEAVNQAKDMHSKVVDEAKKQAKEHANEVDWETGEILSKWEVFKNKTVEVFVKLDKALGDALETAIRTVGKKFGEMVTYIGGKLAEIPETVSKNFNEMKTIISTKLEEAKTAAKTKAQEIMTSITGAIKEKIESVKSVGTDIVNGLVRGIGSAKQTVIDKAKEIANSIPEWLKKILNIQSPSKVTTEIGRFVGEGLVLGMDYMKVAVAGKSDELASKIGDSLGKVNSYVQNTVSIIQKQYELWRIQNKSLEGSSEDLAKQLEVQKQKHTALSIEIANTEKALSQIIAKYGETSSEALSYKNQLLDLQIEQAKLQGEIDKTSGSLGSLASAYKYVGQVMDDGSIYQGVNSDGTPVYKIPSKGSGGGGGKPKETDEEREARRERDRANGMPDGYATGTDNARRGWSWVGEQGPELMWFDGGEKVVNHQDSMDTLFKMASGMKMMFSQMQAVVSGVTASPMQANTAGTNITVNVYDNVFRDGDDAGDKIASALRRMGL